MVSSAYTQIRQLIPKLNSKELKEISTLCNEKWSLKISQEVSDNVDVQVLYGEIAGTFYERYNMTIPPLPVLAKNQKDIHKRLCQYALDIDRWLSSTSNTSLRRTEKSIFYRILIELVLDAMDSGSIPITLNYFSNRFNEFRLHFENAFPNYINTRSVGHLIGLFSMNRQ